MRFRWKTTQIREKPKDYHELNYFDYKNPGKLIGEKKVLQFKDADKWYKDAEWEDVYDIVETLYIDKKDIKNGKVPS